MNSQLSKQSRLFVSLLFALALVACLLVSESMAGKNKGHDDIILYNGNIVVRGGGKKGDGGSIVLANQHGHDQHVEMMPSMFDMWGGGRRR